MKTHAQKGHTERTDRMDWSQIWYPGPTRVFSAEEMALVGDERPGRTLVITAPINYALFAVVLMQFAPITVAVPLAMIWVAIGIVGWLGAQDLWRSPTRRRLTVWSLGGVFIGVLFTGLMINVNDLPRGSPERAWVLGVGMVLSMLLTAADGRVRLTVHDTGPGLGPAATDGVGLANSRARLAQAFGERATLRLENVPDGGCLATLDMPFQETSAP